MDISIINITCKVLLRFGPAVNQSRGAGLTSVKASLFNNNSIHTNAYPWAALFPKAPVNKQTNQANTTHRSNTYM